MNQKEWQQTWNYGYVHLAKHQSPSEIMQGRSYIVANEANASLKFQNIKKGQTVSANKKKRLNVQKKLLVQMSHGLFQSSKCWAILDIWTSNVLASNMSKSWTHGAGPVRQCRVILEDMDLKCSCLKHVKVLDQWSRPSQANVELF